MAQENQGNAAISAFEIAKKRQFENVGDMMNHNTTISGTINGEKFLLVGGGRGRPYEGELQSTLNSKTGELPIPMDFLDIVAIFGYPTFSNYHEDTYDLFKSSDGYEYERNIEFENGGIMRTLHKITRGKNGLTGDFRVLKCELEAPDVIGIEPIVEVFIPAGKGKIQSQATLAWRKEDNTLFTAKCSSEYRLNHDYSLPYLQFRFVHFNTNHTQTKLDQKESLHVYRYLPGCDKMPQGPLTKHKL